MLWQTDRERPFQSQEKSWPKLHKCLLIKRCLLNYGVEGESPLSVWNLTPYPLMGRRPTPCWRQGDWFTVTLTHAVRETFVLFLSQMKYICSLQPFTVLGDCGGNGLPAPQLVGMATSPGRGFMPYLHSMVAITALEILWILNTVTFKMIWEQQLHN